jgi:aryl-alcohol dehydrogenase-like predicted oxidoreductase
VPIEETMQALDDLVRSGKVRYIGCSNMFEWEIAEAQAYAQANGLTQFACAQDFYNLLYRDIEKRMEPYCIKTGLGMIPYFPLAGGLLGGVFRRNVTPEPGSRAAIRPSYKAWDSERNWIVQERLIDFAAERGWGLSQLAIAFLLSRPQMATVIAGADKPEHVVENAKCLDITLSEADLAELDRITLVEEDRTIAPISPHTKGELHF